MDKIVGFGRVTRPLKHTETCPNTYPINHSVSKLMQSQCLNYFKIGVDISFFFIFLSLILLSFLSSSLPTIFFFPSFCRNNHNFALSNHWIYINVTRIIHIPTIFLLKNCNLTPKYSWISSAKLSNLSNMSRYWSRLALLRQLLKHVILEGLVASWLMQSAIKLFGFLNFAYIVQRWSTILPC